MNDTTTRRTDSVRVKLAPDMLTRLELQAKAFGMPLATVCAFAVADWIQRRENEKAMVRMATLEATRAVGENMAMSEEQMEKIFAPMLVELVKQQALKGDVCTCTVTEHERQENRSCPVHFPQRSIGPVGA